MTYEQALHQLSSRDSMRLPGRSTYLIRICYRSIGLRYRGTFVVKWWADGRVQLDSGGWRTPTTKKRMTQYSDFTVFQHHYRWYVCRTADWANGTMPFTDRMVLPASGPLDHNALL